MGPAFWRTYDRMLVATGRTLLRVTTLTTRLAATVDAVGAALEAADDLVITGCASLGVLRVGVAEDEPRLLTEAIERLRAFVADGEGSVVVERGSSALRASVDPWGAVAPGPLDLMRALKQAFDPRGILNPGRFVAGI